MLNVVTWYALLAICAAPILLTAGLFAAADYSLGIVLLLAMAFVGFLVLTLAYVWGRLLGVRDWKFLSAPWFLRIRRSVTHRRQLEFSRGRKSNSSA